MIWPRDGSGALLLTTDSAGARYVNGFMRRPSDGALVTASPPGSQLHNGFCVDANKFLCCTAGGAAVTVEHGFARGAQRELVTVASDPAPAYLHHGLKFDSTGRVFASFGIQPTDIASMIGWWKAESIAQANGTPVASWPASGGTLGALTQATGANQPTYNTGVVNGLPAVTFDGVNDFLATAAAASPASISVMVTCRPTVDGAFRYLIQQAAAATWISPFARWAIRWNATPVVEGWVESAAIGANFVTDPGPGAATGAWQVLELTYDQSNINLYRTETLLKNTARVGALTSSNQPIFLGSDTAGAETFLGDVLEVVVCNAGLNPTDRVALANYMRNRAGI
jgi:hypothetical protein